MVVIGATTHQVAIDHAWLIDKNPSTDLEIKLALGHSGHAPAFHTSSGGRDLHTVTDACNGFLLLKEVAGDEAMNDSPQETLSDWRLVGMSTATRREYINELNAEGS